MVANYLSIDFETYSECDLIKCGADVYARHHSTEVLCLAYAFDDGPIHLWYPGEGYPSMLAAFVANGGTVRGHNSGGFELPIWNNVFGIDVTLKLEQIEDTMAQCFAMSLPGSLERAAPAAGLKIEKDAKGKRIMMQLCKPKGYDKDGKAIRYTKQEYPEKYEALYEYCKRDVEVERELGKRLLKLSKKEQELWRLDNEINNRGVYVDLEAANKCLEIVEIEKKRLNEKMKEISGNKIATCNAISQITLFLESHGLEVESMAKADVSTLLDREIPKVCRDVLLLRQEAAKTSTAKLSAMVRSASIDSRMRGMFQYHGASTGRWAGRRVQLQNLPRPNLEQEEIENVFKILREKPLYRAMEEIDIFYGPLMGAISSCLRGFLRAKPGCDLISCDFSAIEARVLAWLADQQSVLDVFRGHGKIYEYAAAGIYNISIDQVTKAQRAVGKVAILALGFGGGKGAFQQMAKNYGVKVKDSEAEEIKERWRASNPKIVRYWYLLEKASMHAVTHPGQKCEARGVTYLKSGSFLWCRLPSGRTICYPYPKIELIMTPWDEEKEALTYMGVDSYTNKWTRLKTYGAKLSENVTQAVARDLMSESMFRLKDDGYDIVMHVHDEIIVEFPKLTRYEGEIADIMSEVPTWAEGLPVDAEGWRGERFRK